MKKEIDTQNRIELAESVRKLLEKYFNGDVIQENILIGDNTVYIVYKSSSYMKVTLKLEG